MKTNFNLKVMFKRKTAVVIIGCIVLTSVFFMYQNCGSGFDVNSSLSNSINSLNNAGELQQLQKELGFEPNLVENCFQSTSTDFNACIFWKNRIAQSNLNLPYAKEQSHAVKIFDEKKPNGDLENNMYVAATTTQEGQNLQKALPDSNGKYNFQYNDGTLRAAQIGAFYWANAQSEFMRRWTGTFYIKTKPLKLTIHLI